MHTEIYLGKEVLVINELGEKERTWEMSDTFYFVLRKVG